MFFLEISSRPNQRAEPSGTIQQSGSLGNDEVRYSQIYKSEKVNYFHAIKTIKTGRVSNTLLKFEARRDVFLITQWSE